MSFLSSDKPNITADSQICKTCKENCCCSYEDAVDYLILCLPEDFGKTEKEIKKNIPLALESGLFRVVDYHSDVFITTAVKDERLNKKIQCVFLTPDGCKLPSHKRPASCRMTEADISRNCPIRLKLEDAVQAWNSNSGLFPI